MGQLTLNIRVLGYLGLGLCAACVHSALHNFKLELELGLGLVLGFEHAQTCAYQKPLRAQPKAQG